MFTGVPRMMNKFEHAILCLFGVRSWIYTQPHKSNVGVHLTLNIELGISILINMS